MTKGGRGATFNVLSVVLLGLTALMCLCYAAVFFVPTLAGPLAAPTRVGELRFPTPTPTPPGPPTMPATWTPTITGTPTETPLPPTPTDTPGPTRTPRPTNTRIPTRTASVTFGPSPTLTLTRSKYPYVAEVTYQMSPLYACSGSDIVGTITDLSGNPVTAPSMIIHVEGDADIDTGSALHPGQQFRGKKVDGISPATGAGFGPSAWNVVINRGGAFGGGTWRVWLIQAGQVSDKIEVRLQGECAFNSAVIRFQQNH